MATRPRWASLRTVALPSVRTQTQLPDEVVIVADTDPFSIEQTKELRQLLAPLPVKLLHNQRHSGLAGTWNTGLLDLQTRRPGTSWVAILDDDDSWDTHHLACCLQQANAQTDVVISGLRCLHQGRELPRQPLATVCQDDFLAGNPGWQGSNTFARLNVLRRAGYFTESLISGHDRDLAIRLLNLPDVQWRFTGQMSATWHLGQEPDALSNRHAPSKPQAIRQFLALHQHRMSASIRQRFDARNRQLFGVDSSCW